MRLRILPLDDKGASSHNAFTLLELLIVIVVVAILASLLVPSFSKVKQRGQNIQCISNVRQMMLAWTMFTADNEDHLPPNMDAGEGVPGLRNWVAGSMAIEAEARDAGLLTDPDRSLLGRYLESAVVFKCPADKSANVRSISMNNRMNPMKPSGGQPAFTGGYGTNYCTYRKLSEIQNPSQTFVFIDERSDTINDGYFCVDLSDTGDIDGAGIPNPYYIIDYPASYHNQASAVTFADGHTEGHKWLEGTTMPPIGAAVPRKNTGSSDRDVEWLQRHTTQLR